LQPAHKERKEMGKTFAEKVLALKSGQAEVVPGQIVVVQPEHLLTHDNTAAIVGKLKKDLEELRKELLSINGIGPETADSIILYAAEKPMFVIDAYTKRIMSRMGNCKETVSYDELQGLFMKGLEKDVSVFKEYHALLVEQGKNICKKSKPQCKECVLTEFCKKRF